MVQLAGLRPEQLLQLLGSIGVNDPGQLAELLAQVGFRPPPQKISALGELAQPVDGRAQAPLPPEPAPPKPTPPTPQPVPVPAPAPPPPPPKPEPPGAGGPGGFLEALAAIQIPGPPAQQQFPSLAGGVPRGGGTIDPRQLAALLELLTAGQGAAGGAPVPSLGRLIGGV